MAVKLVLAPPRTVAPGKGGRELRPWLEVTLVVRVLVPAWEVDELVFAHWAARWEGGATGLSWRAFEPGRWAATVGEPAEACGPRLDTELAGSLVVGVLELLPREMYCQPALGFVSALGESFSAFRHRCLKAVARTVQEGLMRRDPKAAQVVAQVVDGIERRSLGPEERQVVEARVGVAYYPEGLEPGLASEDLMVERGQGWRA